MKSMTGYGKGVAKIDGLELTVELKSVNNRFLEVNNRIPRTFVACDTLTRGLLANRLSRGSVDAYYNFRNAAMGDKTLAVDTALARQYVAAAETLNRLGVKDDFAVTALLRFPDVVKEDDVELDEETKRKLCETAMNAAIDALTSARTREGDSLRKDLSGILDGIRSRVDRVAERAPGIAKEYEGRLRRHMKEVLGETPIDETKILNEIAAFIDRADTNEEIQRLRTHIEAFYALLDESDPVGRQMDFLTQELVRETNTLGSKCSDTVTTNLVLELKNEIEKLKEQSRNVE